MWNWNAASASELQQRLKTIPFDVPPRGKGRTKQHIENWVLRHLLWTLANTTSLLTYPLSLRKGERPDLDCKTASTRIGIEVTEGDSPALCPHSRDSKPGSVRRQSLTPRFSNTVTQLWTRIRSGTSCSKSATA